MGKQTQQIGISRAKARDYLNSIFNEHSIYLTPTDSVEKLRIIHGMKSKYSTGPDGISSILMKELAQGIAIPLTVLINLSLSEGIFPDSLKVAKVVPI